MHEDDDASLGLDLGDAIAKTQRLADFASRTSARRNEGSHGYACPFGGWLGQSRSAHIREEAVDALLACRETRALCGLRKCRYG